ncbi:CPBP family glutamic-type intramembrane protease [Planctomycetaceae bacterium SH139]
MAEASNFNPLERIRYGLASSPLMTWLLLVGVLLSTLLAFIIASVLAVVIATLVVDAAPLAAPDDKPAGQTVVAEKADAEQQDAEQQDDDDGQDARNQVAQELMLDRTGFTWIVLLPQLSLVVLPILAAYFFPGGIGGALAIGRGNWPLWGWLAAAAATPLLGLIVAVLLGGLVEESETLRSTSAAMRHHGTSGFLFPLVLLIGVTPAICEEILFRGFLQRRLTQLLPAWLGILLASVAFAALHVDPVHALGVLPLGLWLGFLAHASGSLWPAIFGHFTNNTLAIFGVLAEDSGAFDLPALAGFVSITVVGLLGFSGIVLASLRTADAGNGALPPSE